MRTCDLQMDADVWTYTPSTHKCEHFGLERHVAIGPRVQGILQPLLKPTSPQHFIFSPCESEAKRRRAMATSERRR